MNTVSVSDFKIYNQLVAHRPAASIEVQEKGHDPAVFEVVSSNQLRACLLYSVSRCSALMMSVIKLNLRDDYESPNKGIRRYNGSCQLLYNMFH
jgi:hypothetical protein